MVQNKGLIFKEYPTGWPVVGKHIAVEAREFDLDQAPPAGGLTAKVNSFALDPFQRGRMKPSALWNYAASYQIGEPVWNMAIVTVLKSDHAQFQPGDVLYAPGACAEEYTVLPKQTADKARKLHNPHKLDTKHFLGALGMPGLTAYSSFHEIGQPRAGETILISAASGAVGQIVGQLAKREGLRVIGSVGDDKKLDFILNDLGFDGGFNYKREKPSEALPRLAPDGLDIYFENVGGEHLDAALVSMKPFGRVIGCGMISQYNLSGEGLYGVKNLRELSGKRLRIQGFIVTDSNMGPKYDAEHQENVQKWMHEGSLKAQLSITDGIDGAAEALVGIFEGKNFGKAVCALSETE